MKNIAIILLVFTIFGCNDLLLKSEVIPSIISIFPELQPNTNVFADGKTRIRFNAQIDPSARQKYQKIKFKSFFGELIGAVESIQANEEGFAFVDWQVPDSAGIYSIFAEIGEGENVKVYSTKYSIEIKEINRNLEFKIEKPNQPINADNKSTLTLDVQINAALPEKYKTIIFKATHGSFTGTGEAQIREIKVDENGKATLYWKAGTNAGKLYFSVEIKGVVNSKVEKEIELKALKPYYAMSLENTGNVLADGSSVLKIRIDSAVNITNNRIKLSYNTGVLNEAAGSPIENDFLTLVSGKGVAYLKIGNVVEEYFIKTETENKEFFSNSRFKPKRAFAEQLFVESVQSDDGNYAISVFLSRTDGKVSIGTPVSFEAYQMIDGEEITVGAFEGLREALSNVEEKVEVVLKLDDKIDLNIPLKLRVWSAKNNSDDLITISKTL